jgi:hypothetical protein
VAADDVLVMAGLRDWLRRGGPLTVENRTRGERFAVVHDLSPRQVEGVLAGSLIERVRKQT